MKKIFKWLGIILLALVLGLVGFGWYKNEPLPQSQQTPAADSVAKKMLQALGDSAWQKTNLVAWNFSDRQQYLWDKQRNRVMVSWKDTRVLLNLSDWPKGKAYVNGVAQTGNDLDVARGQAWKHFCNDSFWLIAPSKIFDAGTERGLVPQPDGSNALLVTYKSGGVTPKDSYLWFLDKNYVPVSYKMWVSIIPIGGTEATWEDWQKLPSGALVATKHKLGPLDLRIKDLKAGQSLSEMGLKADPFAEID
jgi:hypothetical protein